MIRRTRLRSFPRGLYWEGGGGGGDTTQTVTPKLHPLLEKEIGPFAKFAKGVVHKPYKKYKGQLVAGFNPDAEAAFGLARQGSGANELYRQMLGGGPFQGGISGQERTASSYLDSVLRGTARQKYEGEGQDYLAKVMRGNLITGAERQAGDYLGSVIGGREITDAERQAGGYLGNVIGGREISDAERESGSYLGSIMRGREVSDEERAAGGFLGSFYDNRQNPYFEDQLGIGRRRMGEQYEESIAPGIASKFALAGAFGGTAGAEAEQRAQRELARGLGEYETGSRSAEQERRYAQGLQAAGLTEATAGRRLAQGLQAAGLTEETAGRRIGQGLQAAGQVEGTAGRRIGQGLQAAGQVENTAGRRIGQGLQAQSGIESNAARLMQGGLSAAGLVENTAARRGSQALQDAQIRAGLIGGIDQSFQGDYSRLLGAAQAQQAQQQNVLNARYGQFQRKIDYPAQQLAQYQSAIGALTGALPAGQTNVTSAPSYSPGLGAQIGGGALTAASIFSLLGGGGLFGQR